MREAVLDTVPRQPWITETAEGETMWGKMVENEESFAKPAGLYRATSLGVTHVNHGQHHQRHEVTMDSPFWVTECPSLLKAP